MSCRECPLRRKPVFRPLSAAELDFIARMKRQHLPFEAGADILPAGAPTHGKLYTLYEGWALRYRRLADGSTQLLDILLPGDLIGLSALLLDENRYGVRALTAVSVCMLDGHCITALYQEHAALGLDLLAARLREQERADARIAMLARLSAPARTGYLLLEVRDRLRQRGLARGVEWEFPLRRGEIADAVGLSKVHLMRALRDLRARGLAQLEGRRLRIPNVAELARFSGYVAARATPPLAIL